MPTFSPYNSIACRHLLRIFFALVAFAFVLWVLGIAVAYLGFGEIVGTCRPDTVDLFTWQEFLVVSTLATFCCMLVCAPLLVIGWSRTSSKAARLSIAAVVLMAALVASRAIQFDWVKTCFGATW